jgi:hypothetical protein
VWQFECIDGKLVRLETFDGRQWIFYVTGKRKENETCSASVGIFRSE